MPMSKRGCLVAILIAGCLFALALIFASMWASGRIDSALMRVLNHHIAVSKDSFASISVGYDHNCALRHDGSAVCWGSDVFGQASPPADERFSSISSGSGYTCGLRFDSRVLCWGNDVFGQASPPVNELFTSISAGGDHACGLRSDGIAICWGRDSVIPSWSESYSHYSLDPMHGERFALLSSGNRYTCGLRFDSTVICWGDLVYYDEDDILRQVSPPNDVQFSSISGSRSVHRNFCGVRRTDGEIFCWVDRWANKPTGKGYTQISVEEVTACALREDGTVACGQMKKHCGFDTFCEVPLPSDKFSYIGVGRQHVCGLRKSDGRIVCWTWAYNDDMYSTGVMVP